MIRARILLILVLATGLLAGCRNPFNPSADASLMALVCNSIPEVHVLQISGVLSETNFKDWEVRARFLVRNRVGVNLRSVNIVYTNVLGEEVTQYRSAGGKTYRLTARLAPMPSGYFPGAPTQYGWGVVTEIPINVVDKVIYNFLDSITVGPAVLFAHVTFWGEDDNGYDVKLSSDITIKGYDF